MANLSTINQVENAKLKLDKTWAILQTAYLGVPKSLKILRRTKNAHI